MIKILLYDILYNNGLLKTNMRQLSVKAYLTCIENDLHYCIPGFREASASGIIYTISKHSGLDDCTSVGDSCDSYLYWYFNQLLFQYYL